jgi:hypothetical protein
VHRALRRSAGMPIGRDGVSGAWRVRLQATMPPPTMWRAVAAAWVKVLAMRVEPNAQTRQTVQWCRFGLLMRRVDFSGRGEFFECWYIDCGRTTTWPPMAQYMQIIATASSLPC